MIDRQCGDFIVFVIVDIVLKKMSNVVKDSYDSNRINANNWNYDVATMRKLSNMRRRVGAFVNFFNKLANIPASLLVADGAGGIILREPATIDNQFLTTNDSNETGLDWDQVDHQVNILDVGVNTHDIIDDFINLSKEKGALVIGDSVGVPSRFTMGTTAIPGEMLVADSSEGQGMRWDPLPNQIPFTTKGDILSHDGINDIVLPIGGVNGEVLTADPLTSSGLDWKPIPSDAWAEPTTKGGLAYYDGAIPDFLGTFPVGADGQVLKMDSTNGVYGWRWVATPPGAPPVPFNERGSLLTYFDGSEQELLMGENGQLLSIDSGGKLIWVDKPSGLTDTVPQVTRFIFTGDDGQNIRASPNFIGIGIVSIFYDRLSKLEWLPDPILHEIDGDGLDQFMKDGAFYPVKEAAVFLEGTHVIVTNIKWSASSVSFFETDSTLTATHMRAQWSADSKPETHYVFGDPFSNPLYRLNNDQILSEKTQWSPRSVSGDSATTTFTHTVRVDSNGIVEHGVSEGNTDPAIIFLRAGGTISTGLYNDDILDLLPKITVQEGSTVTVYYYPST